ncbi:MAG: phospholipid carrier-dependent glycosyltransferase [Kiritimatiellae bacterium]|nr:phospholipid carrier-dependent glycosyltransferase [Kiritimatiellia bacterium]
MKTGRRILLWVILAAALLLRLRGIAWPKLHPDEHTIGQWIAYTAGHSHVEDRVYPGGFFTLARPARRCAMLAARAHAWWRQWTGTADRANVREFDDILFGRQFNVGLGVLTCLLVYLLAGRVSGSAVAALAAAALCAFHAGHIEHCHYAETDIAMAFTLALALLLWTRAFDVRRNAWFVTAALATGFAVGTKYSLLPILVLVPAYPLVAARHAGRLQWRRCLLLGLVGGGVFVIGFVWANPGALELGWFLSGLRRQGARLAGELARRLGGASGRGAAFALRARDLTAGLAALGPAWLALAGAGVLLSFTPRFRRQWPVLLLAPALLLAYLGLAAPFVRRQELLALLPPLACWAGLPLAACAGSAPSRARNAARIAVGVAACWALVANAATGIGLAAFFGWQDSRLLANRWLKRHAPADKRVAAELYTRAACEAAFAGCEPIHKVERKEDGHEFARESGCTYLLRNATLRGRGIFDPLSRRRFPAYQRRLDAFFADAERLRVWAPLPNNRVGAAFYGHEIELFGLHRYPPGLDLRLGVSRPVFLSEAGKETFFAAGDELGSAMAVAVSAEPCTIAAGGPQDAYPVYLIFNTDGFPARVRVRCFGLTHRVALDPYDVQVLPVAPGRLVPRLSRFDKIVVRADPEKHVGYMPCFVRVAFSVREAARVCAQLGFPERAWLLLEPEGEQARLDAPDRFLLAVETARWQAAERTLDQATAALARLNEARTASADAIRINGIGAPYYDDFARLRMTGGDAPAWLAVRGARKHEPPEDRAFRLEMSRKTAGRIRARAVSRDALRLPVRLARGRYTLELAMRTETPIDVTDTDGDRFLFVDESGTVYGEGRWSDCAGDPFTPYVLPVPAGREREPRIHIVSERAIRALYRQATVRWSAGDVLETASAEFTQALAAWYLHRGDAARALELLKERPPASWNELALRRLEFEALRTLGGAAAPDDLVRAAQQVLAVAPGYYPCITALASSAAPHAGAALESNLAEPVVFAPFVALVGCRREGASIRLVFEALKDQVPALAVSFYERSGRRWKRLASQPLSARPVLWQGERVVVELAEFGEPDRDSAELAITLHSPRFGTRAPLPVVGQAGDMLELGHVGVR